MITSTLPACLALLGLGLVLVLARQFGRNMAFHRAALANWPAPDEKLNPRVSIIIPAYNEQTGIEACLDAVVSAAEGMPVPPEVIVVDDRSVDETGARARAAAARHARTLPIRVLSGEAPPPGRRWNGKNWACTQGARAAGGDWLLFIDVDVRLQKGRLVHVIAMAQARSAGLTSITPRIVYTNAAERLLQPLMVLHLGQSIMDFAQMNDPAHPDVAGAAGAFMLFTRRAYDAIGGQAAIAEVVLDDFTLARRIKEAGERLLTFAAPDVATCSMYPRFSPLFEGW